MAAAVPQPHLREEVPRNWGLTDEQLATHPHAFRDDLLAGKTCLISGGGSGMGRAMAFLFARLGAEVMICGRREERLRETAEGIQHHLGREIGLRAMTIRDPAQVDDRVVGFVLVNEPEVAHRVVSRAK